MQSSIKFHNIELINKLYNSIILSVMSPQLANTYQQSQKGTQTTGYLTGRFPTIEKKTTNLQPVDLYKEGSESSDAQIVYKQDIILHETEHSGQLPKKLPLSRHAGLDGRGHRIEERKYKKYTSIQEMGYQNEKTEAELHQIKKYIKKGDRLNEENYKKIQKERTNIPIFNTSSNINIYKSNKNILEEIGGQNPNDKRIRTIYLRNQRTDNQRKLSKTKNYPKKGGKTEQTKFNRKPKTLNKTIDHQPATDRRTIEIQTQLTDLNRKQAKKQKAKINSKPLDLIEEDPDSEPAIPKKTLNTLAHKRNQRIFSNTISVLEASDVRKQENMKIGDIMGQRSHRYSKANAQQYLSNLTQTQYDFLASIKNDRRSLSAFNTEAHPYQPTIFKHDNQPSMLNKVQKKTNEHQKPKFIGKNDGGQKFLETLEPLSQIPGDNLWNKMVVQGPVLSNLQIVPKKIQTEQKNNKMPLTLIKKTEHKQTENSLFVQKNVSEHNYSNTPEYLQKNISKLTQNNNIFMGKDEIGTGTYNSFLQNKNIKAVKNRNNEPSSPLLNLSSTEKYRFNQQHPYINNSQITKYSNLQKPIQKVEKSIQAPQIPQLEVGMVGGTKHKPLHPITISFEDKDKQWIQNQYYPKKMKDKIANISDGSKILPENFVIKKYRNGVYFGEVDDSERKNGYGVIFYYNGRMYEGQFKNDMKSGRGLENLPDGSLYSGQFKQGLKNGKGTFTWANGKEVYEGQWANGKRNGSGMWKRLVRDNKYDIYIGEWKNGKIQGFGVLTVADGHRYEGQFLNSQKQGLGTERYDNGDTYVGEFKKGRPNGNGEYFWSTGSYYKGQFSNGLKHGRGYFKGERIQIIDEQIQLEKIQRKALKKKSKKPKNQPANNKTQKSKEIKKQRVLIKTQEPRIEEVEYVGEFRNDKKCGFGEENVKVEGKESIYRGNFENDMRHGYGQISQQGQFTISGYWINGKKVGEEMSIIMQDQLERVESIPQIKANRRAIIQRQEIAQPSKKNRKSSISPIHSPKRSIQKSLSPGDPNFQRPCGCKRNH